MVKEDYKKPQQQSEASQHPITPPSPPPMPNIEADQPRMKANLMTDLNTDNPLARLKKASSKDP